uniref:Uncharacterized protein n=1 Tax=Rhizophagus irregularis (strain DAOM 181602 / DAOM 197198 / MUCL 43194) TaxID=747089 RepID=U9TUE6_RHIID
MSLDGTGRNSPGLEQDVVDDGTNEIGLGQDIEILWDTVPPHHCGRLCATAEFLT